MRRTITKTIFEYILAHHNDYRITGLNILQKKIIEQDKFPNPSLNIFRKFHVKACQMEHGMYYVVSPKKKKNNLKIMYLHGGAFIWAITSVHYDFIEKIILETNATVYIVLYPLSSPTYSAFPDMFPLLREIWLRITGEKNQRLIIMGDSSGGCLALSFAQYIKKNKLVKPQEIIAISPCPRFDYDKEEMISYSKLDPVLSDGLLLGAYNWYLVNHPRDSYQASAYYGDSKNIGNITLIVGEREVFIFPVYEYHKKLLKQEISHNLFIGKDMVHDFAIFSLFKESHDAFKLIKKVILEKN